MTHIMKEGEFSFSVCWEAGRPGPEGWPGGWLWHMECDGITLYHYSDLGGNPFRSPDDWLLPLTGYRREEFLRAFGYIAVTPD